MGPTQTGSFPGVKRPGRDVGHPPPSSAGVAERLELYLYLYDLCSTSSLGLRGLFQGKLNLSYEYIYSYGKVMRTDAASGLVFLTSGSHSTSALPVSTVHSFFRELWIL